MFANLLLYSKIAKFTPFLDQGTLQLQKFQLCAKIGRFVLKNEISSSRGRLPFCNKFPPKDDYF